MNNKLKAAAHTLHRCTAILLLVSMVLCAAACANQKEPLRAPEQKENMEIQTQYGTLEFPVALSEKMRHVETVEGNVAVEVFFMVGQDGDREVFRICYADANVGTLLGYLTTDSGEISVTYALCEYENESFSKEDDLVLFHDMMGAFSVVTNSIQEDARYSQMRAIEGAKAKENELRYWTVTLPENVQFVESEANNTYRADFYGMVGGEKIDLFYVGLGNMEADSVLGYFTVNGEQKPVVVGNYDLDAYEMWAEEEKFIIYNMMSSLNDVIQSIVSHENFSEYEN